MNGAAASAPQKISERLNKIRPSVLIVLGAGSFVADRLFKMAALASPEPRGWIGWAELTLFRNAGIAFSLPLPNAVFWPLAAIALTVVLYALIRALVRRDLGSAAAFSLIILGAASNLTDRYLYGATIDYLLFFGISAINIADVLIVSGVILLLLRLRRSRPAVNA